MPAPAPKPPLPFWSAPTPALLSSLSATPAGLTSAEAARRLTADGPNSTGDGRGESAWRLLLNQFRNPLVLLLLQVGE